MTPRVSTTYVLYRSVTQIRPRINPNHYETTAQGKKNTYVKRLSGYDKNNKDYFYAEYQHQRY